MIKQKHIAYKEQTKTRTYDHLSSYLDGLIRLGDFVQVDSLLKGWEPEVMGKEQTVVVLLATKSAKDNLLYRNKLINKFESFLLRTEISLREIQERILKFF